MTKKKDNTNSVVKALRPFGQALCKARKAARKQEWKKASDLYLQASLCCKTGGEIRGTLEREACRLFLLSENPPTFQPLTEEKTGRYIHKYYKNNPRKDSTNNSRSFHERMGEL